MAQVTRYPFVRQLRSEPTVHTLRYTRGDLVAEGRGLAFFFRPQITGVAEVPIDDRDATFLFRARTEDFQEVAVQGVVTYRVVDPARLADRVDFTVDLVDGTWRKEPLEQVGGLLTQLAQQAVVDLFATVDLHAAVREGLDRARQSITAALTEHAPLDALGLELVAVRVQSVRPDAELEVALQTPVQEAVQQQADEARFARRALAVEKERAIAENELNNRLELARRQEELIAQDGANRQAEAEVAASERRIQANVAAEQTTIAADAQAAATRATGAADAESQAQLMEVYRDLPLGVMLGLAARELAGKLERIDHLNLSPDAIGPLLTNLMGAATRQLEQEDAPPPAAE